MDLHLMSLTEIISLIKSHKITQQEVFTYFQNRIKTLDPQIEAFDVLQEFSGDKSIDSPLAGIPLGLKEVYSEKGVETNASSRILEGFKPPYDCTIVDRLKKAGFTSM
jgi:aspartyl-tRNA(Asn)/glutamyl-tRNA(Gln) amidotransferase subunit A